MIEHLQHMAAVRPAGLDRDAAQWAVEEIERLRAAAERVCWFDWSGNDPDAVQSIDALRELLNIQQPSEG